MNLYGWDIAVHTNIFTSATNTSMVEVQKSGDDVYINFYRKVTVIASKNRKTRTNGKGVSKAG